MTPARKAVFAALAATAALAGFLVWWLIDGGASLDATMLRFTGWLMRGLVDDTLSLLWPLGEPQFGVAAVLGLAILSIGRRRYRDAALIAGGFLVLSAAEVAIGAAMADVRHVSFNLDALTHLPPSGHTARMPYLGTAAAAIAGSRARGWILGVTAVLAILVALERTDSLKQTGSSAVGGLLMGISASLWFAVLFSAWAGRGRARS